MKTNKILVETEGFTQGFELDRVYDYSEDTWKRFAEKEVGEKVMGVYDGNTHHFCKYCGAITEGTDEDVLCAECRCDFGHAFYSEL